MELPELSYLVRLRLTADAGLPFFHGGVLRGLLSRAFEGHELPPGLVPFAAELGRVSFHAGDPYHLGLTFVGDARAEVERLYEGLVRVGAERRSPAPTLAGNFEVEAFEGIAPPDLARDLEKLDGRESLTLHFLSPLRLERPEPLKEKGHAYLDRHCFPAGHFLTRLWNRLVYLRDGAYPPAGEPRDPPPPLPAGLSAEPGELLWLDVPVRGAPGKRPYTLGGCLGRVRLDGLSADWLAPLLAGQLGHAGTKPHFGFGAYLITELDGPETYPFRPAFDLLDRALRPSVLMEALDHVTSNSEATGVDGVDPENLEADPDLWTAGLAAQVEADRYRPSPLAGFLERKEDGGVRPLAVATVKDRVLARAVANTLAPPIDTLLEQVPYAYRKGFSRAGAARAIQRAYEEGYRYVLDADVDAFFDRVDWQLLSAKLDALFPFDRLLDLVTEWVQAPVRFDGREIRRTGGLPQGSPISPLLANLYLDEFDEAVLGADYRLVRYADDFVVLAKSLDEAERSRAAVRRALDDLGLELAEEKTAVRSIDHGFTYLGYLFCRSLAIEQKKAKREPAPLDPAEIPRESWLARVPFLRIRQLVEETERSRTGRSNGGRPRKVRAVPLGTPCANGKRPLYVANSAARLSLSKGALLVTLDGESVERVPLGALSHVVFVGHSRVTTPLLRSLGRAGVPAYFCRRNGSLTGAFEPFAPDWSQWMAQARMAEDEAGRRRFSAEVVGARLHNMAATAVRLKWSGADDVVPEIRRLRDAAAEAGDLDSLRGLEGTGTRLYLERLADSLPDEWGFAGREKRPPTDPVNALLSFGYSLLHRHLSTALTVAGLNPRIGIYHERRGAHHALASDLQEEQRTLVEALVWSEIRQRRIDPREFAPSADGRYPCLMKRDLRRRFIAAFERRLHTEFTPPGEETAITYRELLARQARAVRDLVTGRRSSYRALRLQR